MRNLASLLVLSLLLAGCAVSDDDSGSEGLGTGSTGFGQPTSTATGDQGPRGDPHGEPQVDEGEVETGVAGTGYVASKTITYSNGVGNADAAEVELSIPAGAIVASSTSQGSYGLELVLEGRGATEEQAREALDSMVIEFSDQLSAGDLVLLLSVDNRPLTSGNLPLNVQQGRSATITASLPGFLPYDLEMTAGSGDLEARDLAGPALVTDTGSGSQDHADVDFGALTATAGSGGIDIGASRAARLVVETGSGSQTVEGTFNTIAASAGSGTLRYDVAATASGQYAFETGSGGITVDLRRTMGQGFDVTASNGSGSIDVDLSDGQDVGPQDEDHVHVRSQDYDIAKIQTSVHAEAGSGSIRIAD